VEGKNYLGIISLLLEIGKETNRVIGEKEAVDLSNHLLSKIQVTCKKDFVTLEIADGNRRFRERNSSNFSPNRLLSRKSLKLMKASISKRKDQVDICEAKKQYYKTSIGKWDLDGEKLTIKKLKKVVLYNREFQSVIISTHVSPTGDGFSEYYFTLTGELLAWYYFYIETGFSWVQVRSDLVR